MTSSQWEILLPLGERSQIERQIKRKSNALVRGSSSQKTVITQRNLRLSSGSNAVHDNVYEFRFATKNEIVNFISNESPTRLVGTRSRERSRWSFLRPQTGKAPAHHRLTS